MVVPLCRLCRRAPGEHLAHCPYAMREMGPRAHLLNLEAVEPAVGESQAEFAGRVDARWTN